MRSYKEAQQWLKSELGIEKQYNTVRMYLKRNFGTKLKVGRKSHIKRTKRRLILLKKLIKHAQKALKIRSFVFQAASV
ncbi:MAG: hypothetical protein IPL35_00285 [Sphingobacteriales bacterium]|nr:hypothetical protein [Sphingobacteriales bacterium]